MADRESIIQSHGLSSPESRALLDTVPDALVVVDCGGRILLANIQAERLFGYRRDDLVGEPVEMLIPGHLAETHAAHRAHFLANPEVRPMGARMDLNAKRRDGSEFPVEISLSPLESEDGIVVSASIRDVTEYREIEARQRWHADFSAGVIDSLPGVFYLIDASGRMRRWNSNLETVSGYSGEEVARMSPFDFFDEAEHPRIRDTINEVFEHGGSAVDAPLRTKSGTTRDFHFLGHRITLGDEQFLTGLGIDVTSVRKTETALEYVSGLQRMLVEASRRFIASGSTHLDELITDVLGRVGEYCEVDRSYLFRFKQDRQLMDNTHEWCAQGISPEMENLQDLPREAVPNVVTLMERREVMHVPRVAELGPEWTRDREIFEEEDIQSLIVVPIVVAEELHGFIGFDSVQRERTWDEQEIRLLQVLADLIGAVIHRESAASALRDSEALRSNAEKLAHLGSWEWNIGDDTFRASEEWRRVTGCHAGPLTRELVFDIAHPEDLPDIRARLERTLTTGEPYDIEHRIHRQDDGELRWIKAHAELDAAPGSANRLRGFAQDITEQREAERRMLHLAHYDPVTDLPNRILALDRLDQLLKASRRTRQFVAVLFLDLDHFKKVNDSLGHEAGDELLREAATRLLGDLREQDTVARFGGDEYLILLDGLEYATDAQPVAEKLLESFRDPFHLLGRELMITASVGIAVAPTDGITAQDLLRNADMAMYQSKVEGRNTYHYFTDVMNRNVERRLAVEEQLRGAVGRDELSLAYQPLVDLSDDSTVGAEALARWHNPVLGEVRPDEFIPIAEQTGMIDNMGYRILELALTQAACWRRDHPDFLVSVNVSPQQFRDPNLIARIGGALDRAGLPGDALQVEITESVLLDERIKAGNALEELKRLGVRIAMDDFGTGYASLSYLRRFPFDALKIDRSFVGDITENPHDCELVIASLALAHNLGLTVTAEGVETRAQLALLREHGCDLAQGYLFSAPIDAEAFTASIMTSSQAILKRDKS